VAGSLQRTKQIGSPLVFEGVVFLIQNIHDVQCPGQRTDWHTLSLKTLRSNQVFIFSFHGATAPRAPGPPHYRGFTITLRHTTLGNTALDGWWARRRDLYLTIHNNHKRQASMPPAGFEPKIPRSKRPQTHALDGATTGDRFK
jgi:hypothetical protein